MPRFNRELLRQSEKNMGQESILNKLEIEKAMELNQGKRAIPDGVDTVAAAIDVLLQDGKKLVEHAPIELFDDNPNNHWHRISGEKWEEFVSSIREVGILTPLIVRRKQEGRFEILAGHNRKHGAIEAGLTELPYMVMDVDDVKASVIMAVTNDQREGTSDLEWGWAYRNTYETLKRSAGRPKEDADGKAGEIIIPSVGTIPKGIRTVEVVARMYGVGRGTVERKIRLTYLVEPLYDICTKKGYTQKVLNDLSYLPEPEQLAVAQMISGASIIVTEETAKMLREKMKEHAVSIEEIRACCTSEDVPEKAPDRRRKYYVDEVLFPEHIKKNQRENYIICALEYIREHQIVLDQEGMKDNGV